MAQRSGTQLPSSRYRILSLVGRGQFGRVYVARHRVSGQLVALKELDQQRFPTHQFLRELRFLLALRHPNIVTCQALEHTATGRYLVMDYCEGGTLRAVIQEESQLALSVLLNLTSEVLSGLSQAHQQGIIHCDVKPENILLNLTANGWTARISDFGIAHLQPEPPLATRPGPGRGYVSSHDRQGNSGSPAYMAPERFYGEFSVSSDLYAVGIILYEMLLGERPFSGLPAQLMSAHLNQPVSLPTTLAGPLREILQVALQKLPARRFKSAAQMLSAVQAYATTLARSARASDRADAPMQPRRPLSPLDLTQPGGDAEPLRLPLNALQVIEHATAAPLLGWAAGTQVGWQPLPERLGGSERWAQIPIVELSAAVQALHRTVGGCYAATRHGLYRVQPAAVPQVLLQGAQNLVSVLEPGGRWLATASHNALTFQSLYSGVWSRPGRLPEAPNLPTLTPLDRHHLAVVCVGEHPQVQIWSRRGNCMERFDLPMAVTQVVTGPVPYHLLAASPSEPSTLLLIDLKAFQLRRLFLGYSPRLLLSAPWGYITASAEQTLTLLDPVGQIVGNLTLAGQPTAATVYAQHYLLVATWSGQQGWLYCLDLRQLDLELLF